MSWTKRQIIESAFEEIGYATYSFDVSVEQMQSALYRLDAMVGTWKKRGLILDYVVPSVRGNSNLDDDTSINFHMEALYLNLAIRIAPMVGKAASKETKVNAMIAFNQLYSDSAQRLGLIYPDNLPVGQGNKPHRGFGGNEFFIEDREGTVVMTTDHPILTLASGSASFVTLDQSNQILTINDLTPSDIPVSKQLGTITGADINCGSGVRFNYTMAGNVTFTLSNIPSSPNFYEMIVRIIYSSGTPTWSNFTNLEWSGGSAPSFSAGVEYDIKFTTYDGGSNWRGILEASYS